jgi:hypothetical protein
MDNLSELTTLFHQDIAAKALALSMLREDVFIEDIGELLVEAGEMEDCISSSFQGHGLKVDGYWFDEDYTRATLIVSHFMDEVNMDRLSVTNAELIQIFRRCTNFFLKSRKGLEEKIEISNEAHELASTIRGQRTDMTEVKIILITDGLTRKREAEKDTIDEIEFTYVIWDIERICLFLYENKKDSIDIDFIQEFNAPIMCFSQENERGLYKTYLGYISGDTLAGIYGKWGTKLLDMNVRVFLTIRGKVNQGIRDTIKNEPHMFCAYNNGITVFAREVEMEDVGEGVVSVRKVSGFQIINGGQTTASLYHTKKKLKTDISDIKVQMKMIVINDPEVVNKIVPKISEYSNTQNKVSLSDLKANDPPHPELHEISMRLPAPDPTGGSRITHWFYEKARGSYEETINMIAFTPAQRRTFEATYPKGQRFDKNLLGKAWNTYLRKPHMVSLGGQKNFMNFNAWLREQKDEDMKEFFKRTVSLIILWNSAESIVRKQGFEGYRHNIVTYTLSWIIHLTDGRIDLVRIWEKQKVGQPLLDVIEEICVKVNEHIRRTDQNVTEWCKKEECWNTLKEIQFEQDSSMDQELIPAGGNGLGYDPRIRSEIEMIRNCEAKGSDAWFKLATWLKERNFLTGKARSQCVNMGKTISKGREPSAILSYACNKIWEEASIRGWVWENGDMSIEVSG